MRFGVKNGESTGKEEYENDMETEIMWILLRYNPRP